jgi:GT2 family glycosyltransferase
MGASSPWVRIVIVTHNAGELLAKTLGGLAGQTMADFEAVIVDNASIDGSTSDLALPDQRFHLVAAGANLGFAAGCNLGAAGATAPFVAMLNPDAVPEADWLERLRAASLRHPWAAMYGSTQIMAKAPTRLDGAGDNYSIFGIAWRGGYGAPTSLVTRDIRVFSPCAAAALYRRDAFAAVGGFAEGFFCYLEDVDLGFRLRLAGHGTVQVADAKVRHVGSAIAGRHSDFAIYHSTRNGVSLLVRCMPAQLLALGLPLYLLAQCWLSLRTRGAAARMAGLRDGFALLGRSWAQRRMIQCSRRLSVRDVARLLVWNPRRLSRREIVPLQEPAGPGRTNWP